MNQEVKEFYDAMATDESLRAKADDLNKEFSDKMPDDTVAVNAIIAFASVEGFSFTKEDLNAYGESMKNEAMKTLPEDELAAVVGGANTGASSGKCVRCFVRGNCFCVAGGGGQHHEPDWTCACVVAGFGGKCSRGRMLGCGIVGVIIPEDSTDSD